MADIDSGGMNRRGFLAKITGLASGVAAAMMLQPTQAQEERPKPGRAAGYRETEHIRKFYRKARF